MSEYGIKRVEGYEDELQHWGAKGSQKEDHKYISRKMVNGKWVYTYADDLKGSGAVAKPTVFNTNVTGLKNTGRAQNVARAGQDAKKNLDDLTAQRNKAIADRRAREGQAASDRLANLKKQEKSVNLARLDRYNYNIGKKLGSGNIIKSNISKALGKTDTERAKLFGESAKKGYDDATNLKNVAENVKRKVKRKVNRTIREASKAIDKGRDWLEDLFD